MANNYSMVDIYWKRNSFLPVKDKDLFQFKSPQAVGCPTEKETADIRVPRPGQCLLDTLSMTVKSCSSSTMSLRDGRPYGRRPRLQFKNGSAAYSVIKLKIKEELEWGHWASRRVVSPARWEEVFALGDKEFRRRIRTLETEILQSQGERSVNSDTAQ
ncbi:hypothetical protein FA13DRAFT_1715047, partial [Coprinellus micaceus]